MKRILLLLLTLCLLLPTALIACNEPDTPPTPPTPPTGGTTDDGRNAYFHVGNKTETLALEEDATSLLLPTVPAMPGKVFIGWAYEHADGKTLYEGGAQFNLPAGDCHFTAVGVSLYTEVGATASLTAERLRFTATLNGNDYRALAEVLGQESITVGLLIAPYAEVTGGDRQFTLDCGATGLLNRVNTPSLAENCVNFTISGETEDIPTDAILEKYAARAYLTYTHGETTRTIYAPYYPLSHTANLHGASAQAFEDLKESAEGNYMRAVETEAGTYYTRHTDAERALLRARLDRVVNISTKSGGTVLQEYSLNNVEFFVYTHYRSPYLVTKQASTPEVGYDTYVVTAKSGADFNTVTAYFIGGSYRAPDPAEWQSDGIYIVVNNTAEEQP